MKRYVLKGERIRGSKKKPQKVGGKGNNLGIPTLNNRAIPTKAYLRP